MNKLLFIIGVIVVLSCQLMAQSEERVFGALAQQKTLLKDMKADMVIVNYVNGKKIETSLKYYFKSPGLERRENSKTNYIRVDDKSTRQVVTSKNGVIKEDGRAKKSLSIITDFEKLESIKENYDVVIPKDQDKSTVKIELVAKNRKLQIRKIVEIVDIEKGVVLKISKYDQNESLVSEEERQNYVLYDKVVWVPLLKISKNRPNPVVKQKPELRKSTTEEKSIKYVSFDVPEVEIRQDTIYSNVEVNLGLKDELFVIKESR